MISADGVIFEQDPTFGCVINGNVSVINSDFNLYAFSFGYSNCTGQFGLLNGTKYSGLGTLEDIIPPEILAIAATGEVGGRLVSLLIARTRL